MKISKTLIQAIMVAVTVGTAASCSKSIDNKPEKASEKTSKTDSTYIHPESCPACGMG